MKSQYLQVSFMNKILVCDVYTLKHLFKISTGDEEAIFDSHITRQADYEILKMAYTGNDPKLTFTVQSCMKHHISFVCSFD